MTSPQPNRELAIRALPQFDLSIGDTQISGLAGGPRGIVVLGKQRSSGALLAWTSADGEHWTRHWLPGITFGGGTPNVVAAGPFGFVAVGWDPEPGSAARRLWSSADGVSWQPLAGLPHGDVTDLVGGPWGMAAVVDRGPGAIVATTVDGGTWQVAELTGKPISSATTLAELPDGILVLGWSLGGDPSSDDVLQAWRSADGRRWTPAPGVAAAIGRRENSIDRWRVSPWGAIGMGLGPQDLVRVVGDEVSPISPSPASSGHLIGGPAGLIWIEGIDPGTTCAATWQFDGASWQAMGRLSSDRSCVERTDTVIAGSAALADGMLVLGVAGQAGDPVAWLVTPASSTPSEAIEPGSAIAPGDAIPDPLAGSFDRPAACPAVPTTLDAVQSIGPRTAVACFGPASIRFRAWVVDPGEGYGGACPAFTPAWIRECVLPDYLLTSTSNAEWQTHAFHAMRSPTAVGTTNGVGRWVNVVGHYDDAVSSSCRGVGDLNASALPSELPPAVAVVMCRQVFVVTEIRTAT